MKRARDDGLLASPLARIFLQPAMAPIRDVIIQALDWTGHVALGIAMPGAIGLSAALQQADAVMVIRLLMAFGTGTAELHAAWKHADDDDVRALILLWIRGDMLQPFLKTLTATASRNFAGTFQFVIENLMQHIRYVDFTRVCGIGSHRDAWLRFIEQCIACGCGWPELRGFVMRIKRTLVGPDWYHNQLTEYVFFFSALRQGNYRLACDIYLAVNGTMQAQLQADTRTWLNLLNPRLLACHGAAAAAGTRLVKRTVGPCPWPAYCQTVMAVYKAVDTTASDSVIHAVIDAELRVANEHGHWQDIRSWLGHFPNEAMRRKIVFLRKYFPCMVQTMAGCPLFVQWTRDWTGPGAADVRTLLGIP